MFFFILYLAYFQLLFATPVCLVFFVKFLNRYRKQKRNPPEDPSQGKPYGALAIVFGCVSVTVAAVAITFCIIFVADLASM